MIALIALMRQLSANYKIIRLRRRFKKSHKQKGRRHSQGARQQAKKTRAQRPASARATAIQRKVSEKRTCLLVALATSERHTCFFKLLTTTAQHTHRSTAQAAQPQPKLLLAPQTIGTCKFPEFLLHTYNIDILYI